MTQNQCKTFVNKSNTMWIIFILIFVMIFFELCYIGYIEALWEKSDWN